MEALKQNFVKSLLRDRLAPQLCLLFLSGGTPVMLACPQVTLFFCCCLLQKLAPYARNINMKTRN
jgi:hypothetical protein